jgi:hypothetical protein
MKGIVFNVFEEVVSAQYGEETWDALLDAAALDGVYTSLGSYPDAELVALAGAAAERLGVEPDEAVRWLGKEAVPLFAAAYPDFFSPHARTRDFLLTLNEIIHPEVRKLYPGADVPRFDFDVSHTDRLVMGYRSPRQLCAFAEGLVQGAAAHFGERVSITQPTCMKRGDDHCTLQIDFVE